MVKKKSDSQDRTQQLFQKLAKVTLEISSSAPPEAVHDLRTTARRIETLLSANGLDHGGGTRKLARQLARLRRRAGKLRDVDVHIAALATVRLDNGVRDRQMVREHLAKLRNKSEKKLVRALDKEVGNGLEKRTKLALKQLRATPEHNSGKDYTAEALAKFKGLVDGFPPLTEATLHNFRIESKRVRYLAELSGNKAPATRVVAALKRIQDAIGEWHDWLTLRQVADEVLPGNVSALKAALRAQTRSKFNEALRLTADARQELLSLQSKAAAKPVQFPGDADRNSQRKTLARSTTTRNASRTTDVAA